MTKDGIDFKLSAMFEGRHTWAKVFGYEPFHDVCLKCMPGQQQMPDKRHATVEPVTPIPNKMQKAAASGAAVGCAVGAGASKPRPPDMDNWQISLPA